ncbi:MAG: type II toxin-antitoxin system VapC family toxin [Ktedonobacteraceae bacterium]
MSSGVVVDAHIAIKWVLRENDSHIARSLLSDWIKEQVVVLVPTLFTYEITNILYRKARQKEISFDSAKLGITKILSTGLEIAHSEGFDSFINIRAMELAESFHLPATYDAHYLALAESERYDLWTADTHMWNTVKEKLSWVRNISDYQPS